MRRFLGRPDLRVLVSLLIVVLVAMGWPQPRLLSLEALLRPLSPNRPIPGVPGPYALGTPQPGRDGDIVLVATSPTGRVELHVLDRGRWLDAAHTPSFDVAYEVLATSAPRTEAQAVTDAVVAAIERNDPGGLHVVEGSIWRRSTGVERILDPLRGYSSEVVWRRTLRLNSLTVLICALIIVAWSLSAARQRNVPVRSPDILIALTLTGLAAALRFGVARANLMDFGGIPYSRLLRGYGGYRGTAQFYSFFYDLTSRDIEHAILFDRIAGTLTVPFAYVLCRLLQPGARLWATLAASLLAVYPLHVLFSASDALAVFSCFLTACSYTLLAIGVALADHGMVAAVSYLGGFAGLALLTQVRYENVLFLVPPAVALCARRHSLALRRVTMPLGVAIAFAVVYARETAASAISFRNPPPFWRNVAITWHLVLDPLLAIPVLLTGTVAIWICNGRRSGMLALLPWACALAVCLLTLGEAHGGARIYANWLILLLPIAAYGFSTMLLGSSRLAAAIAAAALIYLGLQPALMRGALTARYLEIEEHDRFKALLSQPMPGITSLVVPDDELALREHGSTLEVFTKYLTILDGNVEASERVQLVRLTDYLEHPAETICKPDACAFFFGLPCVDEEHYAATSAQCREVLGAHRTSLIEEMPVLGAPFASCSIYSGALRQRLCGPATKLRRFVLYRIET